jgi:hypothetical protein
MFAVLASLSLKINATPPDQVPEGAKIERFNKTALECPEIYNSLNIVPEHKLKHVYKTRVSFESSVFSAQKYLDLNGEDVAIASHVGDGDVRITILTDHYQPGSYQYVASR